MKTAGHFTETGIGRALFGLAGLARVAGALFILAEQDPLGMRRTTPDGEHEAVRERLMPIGRVRLAAETVPAPAPAPAEQDRPAQPAQTAAPATQPPSAPRAAETPQSIEQETTAAAPARPTTASAVQAAEPTPGPGYWYAYPPPPPYGPPPYPPHLMAPAWGR